MPRHQASPAHQIAEPETRTLQQAPCPRCGAIAADEVRPWTVADYPGQVWCRECHYVARGRVVESVPIVPAAPEVRRCLGPGCQVRITVKGQRRFCGERCAQRARRQRDAAIRAHLKSLKQEAPRVEVVPCACGCAMEVTRRLGIGGKPKQYAQPSCSKRLRERERRARVRAAQLREAVA